MLSVPLTHERTFRIRHYECDSYGHVNHANYVRYMQEAAFDASAAAGYDVARYEKMNRAWLVRETDITYLLPLVHGDSVAFTDADTTPSIAKWNFFSCANTGSTSITDFDDEEAGKEIVVRLDGNTTIVYNSSLIRTNGSADIVGASTNQLVGFKRLGSVWIETWRNF